MFTLSVVQWNFVGVRARNTRASLLHSSDIYRLMYTRDMLCAPTALIQIRLTVDAAVSAVLSNSAHWTSCMYDIPPRVL